MTTDPFPTGPNRPVRIAHMPPLRPRRKRTPGAEAPPPGPITPAAGRAEPGGKREAGAV